MALTEWSRNSQIMDVQSVTGATAASGAIFDMDGFESFIGYAKLESTASEAQLVFKVGTATNAMSEVVGEASGVAPNLYLEVFRTSPNQRYGQFSVFASGGAQNITVFSIAKGARTVPTTNTTLVNGTRLYTPDTGTATG